MPELREVCEVFYVPPLEIEPSEHALYPTIAASGPPAVRGFQARRLPRAERGMSQRSLAVKDMAATLVRQAHVIRNQKETIRRYRARLRKLEQERAGGKTPRNGRTAVADATGRLPKQSLATVEERESAT